MKIGIEWFDRIEEPYRWEMRAFAAPGTVWAMKSPSVQPEPKPHEYSGSLGMFAEVQQMEDGSAKWEIGTMHYGPHVVDDIRFRKGKTALIADAMARAEAEMRREYDERQAAWARCKKPAA